jgi:hypothetical protein
MVIRKSLLGVLVAATLALGVAVGGSEENKSGTIQGYVLDSACAFVRNVKKPMNGGKCALECAKAGSPLVILTEDGTIYWPISNSMPATGQNPRLLDYAGKKVAAQGKVFERGGSHAIAIEKIEVLPEGK